MIPTHPLNIAVLISGNGSNLQALIDAIASDLLPASISVVISNRANAYGLNAQKRANIPTIVLPPQQFPSREAYDVALQSCLDTYHPDLIILAGFMRILGASFVEHFRNRIFNIHPSLLPKYPGLHTHQKVVEGKDRFHGATVHVVTEELDCGAIIAQAQTIVEPQDDMTTLKEKIHRLEHRLYPEVIKLYALGRLRIDANGVFLDEKKVPKTGIKLIKT